MPGDPPESTLQPVTGPRLKLLRSLGFAELQHDSHVPFLSHLIGTRRLLAAWGARPALCDAGLFHSVYGTEYFQPTRTPDRSTVIELIGEEAERIAWLWCAIERATIDPAARTVRVRATGATEALSPIEVTDLATLWAADTVEQVARMTPDERGVADGQDAVLGEAPEPARRALAEVRRAL